MLSAPVSAATNENFGNVTLNSRWHFVAGLVLTSSEFSFLGEREARSRIKQMLEFADVRSRSLAEDGPVPLTTVEVLCVSHDESVRHLMPMHRGQMLISSRLAEKLAGLVQTSNRELISVQVEVGVRYFDVGVRYSRLRRRLSFLVRESSFERLRREMERLVTDLLVLEVRAIGSLQIGEDYLSVAQAMMRIGQRGLAQRSLQRAATALDTFTGSVGVEDAVNEVRIRAERLSEDLSRTFS